jgi:hypothetical protein
VTTDLLSSPNAGEALVASAQALAGDILARVGSVRWGWIFTPTEMTFSPILLPRSP